jgi:hypothetical protein
MPDPQVSPAPNKRRKLGLLAVVLVLVVGAGGAAPAWALRHSAPGLSWNGFNSVPGGSVPWNIVVLLILLTLLPALVLVMLGDQVAQNAPIALCSTPARFQLRRLLEPFLPKVVVLSPLEIPPMVPVQSLGTVR